MKSVTLAGQNFTKRVGTVKLPYIDQLVGFYLFGGSAAGSIPNLAYGASQNLSPIATPTYGTGYATINGTNGFETGLLLDAPFTQIVVAYNTVANSALALTSRGSANADNFVDMLRLGTGAPPTIDGWPDGNSGQSINNINVSGYGFFAQTWGGNATRHIIYALAGKTLTSAQSSNPITKTTTPTHTMKFGTGYNGGSPSVNIAAAAFAAKVLNPQQIFAIGLSMRAFLAPRGITML